MRTFVVCALLGLATAMKWEAGQENAYLPYEPQLPEFDPADVVDWWDEVYRPLLEAHAYDVAMTSWANMEADPERAALLEVCERGQECRYEVDAWMRKEIEATWKIVLRSLQT